MLSTSLSILLYHVPTLERLLLVNAFGPNMEYPGVVSL